MIQKKKKRIRPKYVRKKRVAKDYKVKDLTVEQCFEIEKKDGFVSVGSNLGKLYELGFISKSRAKVEKVDISGWKALQVKGQLTGIGSHTVRDFVFYYNMKKENIRKRMEKEFGQKKGRNDGQ